MIKITVIGDIHGHFNTADIATFNRSDSDLILISGDLADFRSQDELQVADLLAQLKKPTLLIGGNHDCTSMIQFMAEIKNITRLANRDGAGQERRVAELREHLGPVIFAGYSCHDFVINGQEFSVIAGRPFSPGGSEIRIRPYLRRQFAINSGADSIQRLQQLVDKAAHNTLIFLAHNGPSGLGSAHDDIWGCDFRAEGGDYGDPDLAAAISYARKEGKQVVAVIAGHMHHALANGGQRQWLQQDGDTTYINAARVPRIFSRSGETVHHHLALTLDGNSVTVEEMLVAERA